MAAATHQAVVCHRLETTADKARSINQMVFIVLGTLLIVGGILWAVYDQRNDDADSGF